MYPYMSSTSLEEGVVGSLEEGVVRWAFTLLYWPLQRPLFSLPCLVSSYRLPLKAYLSDLWIYLCLAPLYLTEECHAWATNFFSSTVNTNASLYHRQIHYEGLYMAYIRFRLYYIVMEAILLKKAMELCPAWQILFK